MMMCYGLFVFSLKTIPFQQMESSKTWRYPSQSRVNQRPARQFIGIGDDKETFTGVLYPEITGGRVSIELLERMAGLGTSWPLINGSGILLGWYIINSVKTTKTEFFRDGAARKIEFSIEFEKTDPPSYLPAADIIGLL